MSDATDQFNAVKNYVNEFLSTLFDREDGYYEQLTCMGVYIDDDNILTLSDGTQYKIGLFKVNKSEN